MSRPTIALCIPAYRAEEHLPRLLASARQQQPPFDEIIVCVDASPDQTAEVARAAGVTVLENEKNLGCSASKNRALAAATSDWIHFHDADDILLPGFTTEAHHWMSLPDAPDLVIMGFEYRDFQTNELLATGLVDDSALCKDAIAFAICHKLPNFGIYRREKLVRFGGFDCDPAVLYNEDVAFHTKLALNGMQFRASQKITSINWRHGGSMHQTNHVACLKAHHAVMRKVASIVGAEYPEEIASRLWVAATGLASFLEWEGVDAALKDARKIYRGIPGNQPARFSALCRIVGPRASFRLREQAIRIFKPHLRQPPV